MPKMSKLFDQNNMFFAIMGVLFDLIVLNVLTLLCCIPIVTAGAAFTAMHSVLWRMVRHEETYVARQFFESFKRNLRQSILPWLGLLLAAVVLAVDGMLAWSMGSMRGPLVACVAFVGLLLVAVAQYFFPLLSRYEDSTAVHLGNASKLAFGFFPRTLCMLVILAGFAALYMQFFVYMIPLLLLMGVTLPQYCCAWIYSWIFRRIDGEIDAKGRKIQRP
ncbi:YesL family protein [Bifidobacterium moukalabense]|uniref:YesL family protein n=1 Tax=Bifidobacterium moukalabense TaxID=1333651 RepID=UPI0010F60944|nr:YesL family protein [Bifidobacterium moukalabense]